MKTAFCYLGAALALALAGCGDKATSPDANALISNDFETLAGWLPEAQSATIGTAKAHSGRYAIFVDGAHEYSLNYRAALGSLSSTRVKRIRVSAWAFVPSAASQASLVVAVSNPAAPNDKPVVWEALPLGAAGKFNQWVEISKVITLPDNILPTNTLGLYLWRTSGDQPAYLDDLRVSTEP